MKIQLNEIRSYFSCKNNFSEVKKPKSKHNSQIILRKKTNNLERRTWLMVWLSYVLYLSYSNAIIVIFLMQVVWMGPCPRCLWRTCAQWWSRTSWSEPPSSQRRSPRLSWDMSWQQVKVRQDKQLWHRSRMTVSVSACSCTLSERPLHSY